MKSSFSTAWKSSTQVRKQRKYRYNAPLHIRHKFLSAHLSKELRKKYGKRSLPLRKGDEVLVMRGSFAKKKAKVISTDLQNSRVTLEGLQRARRDGTKTPLFFRPGVLLIESLATEDKERLKAIGRSSESRTASSLEKQAPNEQKKESKTPLKRQNNTR
ncbi:MAG TPA: 50S ribosomal protein L24 [Candidatus Nanoarchaeia archaeon]|nr:50S ribosomal protein L24 [Candidatus Nanoarchaeia archaeon]